MSYQILRGDCLAVLRTLPDASFDSIVTDPPYELGFMGKAWDASGIANNVEMWREALRVLKPGGHLLAFSGSRTYHRMTCAIEDAGFEVRDQIFWVYGSGFPKSNNLDRLRGTQTCGCMVSSAHDTTPATGSNEGASARTTGEKPTPEHDLRSLREGHIPAAELADQKSDQDLQPCLPKQTARECPLAHSCDGCETCREDDGTEQPGMEGWGDDVQTEGQLQGHPVHSGAGRTAVDGAGGRLHNGASGGDGDVVRVSTDANGSSASRRPQPGKQSTQQSGTVADEQRAQAPRAWPDCDRCGLPVVPQGWGTALKPAHEPICVARKPLIGTVAANVLAHGTGALNIDGCRVPTNGEQPKGSGAAKKGTAALGDFAGNDGNETSPLGRWPANLIHDGSDEVVALFPAVAGSNSTNRGKNGNAGMFGNLPTGASHDTRASGGGAARFFYCAKASKSDRGPGNTHPTVKPLALMRYLLRLVTPPGGRSLDIFAGSGSTIVAGLQEGFIMTGIELTPEYADIAESRAQEEYLGDLI